MASIPSSLLLFSFILLLLLNSSASAFGPVGQRTEIKNVTTDKTVQSLGLFSVGEYNRGLFLGGGKTEGSPAFLRLSFYKVVAAQKQVVSGTEYFLKVVARDHGGKLKTFDAAVLVKPWLRSQKLISFVASP